jgi:hypothetical protein
VQKKVTVMPISLIRINRRDTSPHKAIVDPLFTTRTVLTLEPWEFVSLWLRRNKLNNALFYWQQGLQFYKASAGLPMESAPLLLYYAYMNAAKALLTSKRVSFNAHHGVKEWSNTAGTHIDINHVGVQIKNSGIVPALSAYYGENESNNRHTLQELFFNMPFIHRTYCLTYKSQTEMFIPLTDCNFVFDRSSKNAYLSAKLSKDYCSRHTLNRLPAEFIPDAAQGDNWIRSTSSVTVSSAARPNAQDINRLRQLSRTLRVCLYYINGTKTLWYLKVQTAGPSRIERQTPTLVLAAMHRLSEICRYQPIELASHLNGRKNWLISEFIKMSPNQYIDELSSEITGHQFLLPNVRPAT